jgi:uncharacterized phage-associated protein
VAHEIFRLKAVANDLVARAWRAGEEMGVDRLHYLCFFAQAWVAAVHDRPLMDELPEARGHGIRYRGLVDEFGDQPARIERFARSVDRRLRRWDSHPRLVPGHWAEDTIDRVWDVHGALTEAGLVMEGLKHGHPWEITRDANPGFANPTIPFGLMRDHYREVARAERARHIAAARARFRIVASDGVAIAS